MKKALLCFVLGVIVAVYWFMNQDVKASNLVKATPNDRLALVSDIFSEWSTDVKAWISPLNEGNRAEITLNQQELTSSDYEAAISILSELIQDLKELFTFKQIIAIEERLGEFYRQNILNQ